MTLLELSMEYDHAYQLLRGRIDELTIALKSVWSEKERQQLKRRIADLRTLARETREIGKVCRNYYVKEAHINGAYTVRYTGQRAPRRSRSVAKSNSCDQRRRDSKSQQQSLPRDSGRADPAAARSAADALLAELIRGSNRRRVRS